MENVNDEIDREIIEESDLKRESSDIRTADLLTSQDSGANKSKIPGS